MRERLQRFMTSRYGMDELGGAISIGVIVCLLISMFCRRWIPQLLLFYWIGILLFAYNCFRMFSKNIPKRYAENQKFRNFKNKAAVKRKQFKTQWAQREIYRFYSCPICRQRVRVPKGRGKICITCPKCKTEFVKKS